MFCVVARVLLGGILRYPFDLFQWKSMGRVAKVL